MMAFPQTILSQPAAATPGRDTPAGNLIWRDFRAVARILGIVEGQVRRKCLVEWQPRGVAEQRSPGDGRRSIWFVREDAEPELARVKQPEHLPFDMTALSAAQRDELLMREKILTDWERARTAGVKSLGFTAEKITEQFLLQLQIETGAEISARTLHYWQSGYRASGRAGLVDGRWKQSQSSLGEDQYEQFRDYQQRLFLKPQKMGKTLCYQLAAAKAQEMGWATPGAKTARRWLESIPTAVQVKMREGNDAFVLKCEPAIERDYSTLRSNEVWIGDDHQFDVMILDPDSPPDKPQFARPFISGWEDGRSRKIVGYAIQIDSPDTHTILRAFCMGLKSHGRPASVMVDNGKVYEAKAIQGVTKKERRELIRAKRYDATQLGGTFGALQIATRHVTKYHGQSKPIERKFGTICSRFSKTFETYCGKDVLSKPEDLQQHLKARHSPTFDEFCAAFAAYLANDYHVNGHGGHAMDGQSPDDVFLANLPDSGRELIPDEIAEFYCMPAVGPVTVGKHGVRWKDMNYGAFDPKVQKLFGQKVMLKLGDGTGAVDRVHLADVRGRYLCTTGLNQKLPFLATQEDLKNAIQLKKGLRRAVSAYREARPKIALDTQALLTSEHARKRAAKRAQTAAPEPVAVGMKIVRTPVDDQLSAIQKAMRPEIHRAAVGAENLDLDSFRPRMPIETAPAENDDIDVFAAVSAAMSKAAMKIAE
jgi:putative transposase